MRRDELSEAIIISEIKSDTLLHYVKTQYSTLTLSSNTIIDIQIYIVWAQK